MTVASLFLNGRNQAVRIPKEYEFTNTRHVQISRYGDSGLLIQPVRKTWLSFADLPDLDSEWEFERPAMEQDRIL